MLLEFGVPADNIILFLNNDIANNTKVNPFVGTLYTDVKKSRNWNKGLKIDYSGADVNVENYIAVLTGELDKVNGGSGRVLKRYVTMSKKDFRILVRRSIAYLFLTRVMEKMAC